MPFTLATWNINSVRLREGLVAKLMSEEAPDVLCLQECKSPVEKIPLEGFAELGYSLDLLEVLALQEDLRVIGSDVDQ